MHPLHEEETKRAARRVPPRATETRRKGASACRAGISAAQCTPSASPTSTPSPAATTSPAGRVSTTHAQTPPSTTAAAAAATRAEHPASTDSTSASSTRTPLICRQEGLSARH